MATCEPRHCSVFVGNIPYNAEEDEIKGILSQVGPIVSWRIVTDKETGKPKGYGFCVYRDEETALSAHRNLQGYEIRGRTLRVNFADKDNNKQTEPAGNQTNRPPVAGDPIALHLAKLPRNHLIEVLSGFKALALHNKEQARQLLQASSPLSRALLQALAQLGLPAPPPPPPASNINLQPPSVLQPQPRTQEPQFPAYRSFPQQEVNHGDFIDPSRPSKMARTGYERAVPLSKPDNVMPQNEDVVIQQNEDFLFQQMLSLKPEQLSSLPLEQRQQIIQLQHMYRQTS